MNKSTLYGLTVLALALVITALIGAHALTHRNDRGNSIVVRGGVEADIESDLIVWQLTIQSKSSSPLQGLRDVERQRVALQQYLSDNGVTAEEILYGAVNYSERTAGYYRESEKRYIEEHLGYIVEQNVTITSNDLDKIEKVARNVGSLIEMNVTAEAYAPKYYYTKLAGLKLKLLAAATEDALERAETIAQHSKCRLGSLKESKMGVFQITGKNSDEDYSWGGSYNTSSREKTISITVYSEFYIK